MKKLKKFFNREQNLLVHISVSILVIIFGFIFSISLLEWLIVMFLIAFVITSELINSAIELTVDLYTTKFHPLAMIAKDTAAGAVVISAFTAALIGLYIFLPKFITILK